MALLLNNDKSLLEMREEFQFCDTDYEILCESSGVRRGPEVEGKGER